ncbi:hypothetical protein B0J11DRAFT_584717 [Dendryphion nanum]|uniref:Zn(2)-C6 fungal-type domain-containing protein n=1 Tax=Dendryphion nanum TaxID=256645 RepID=A0A9P9D7S2_9PLEO|nr:hypothetical protein B0J11DRAFT_584717 [Dendryphion nanum]
MESDTNEVADPSIPSCESCRKRKLKCSRQQPMCANCERLDTRCFYDFERKKPGLKVGAVESLSRRLEVVENALAFRPLGTRSGAQEDATTSPSTTNGGAGGIGLVQEQALGSIISVLSSLTKEISGLNAACASISETRRSRVEAEQHEHSVHPLKRRRTIHSVDVDVQQGHGNVSISPSGGGSGTLAGHIEYEALEELFSAYFANIQPWIPIIHEPSFRARYQSSAFCNQNTVLLKAMKLASRRFHREEESSAPADYTGQQYQAEKDRIVLGAINDPSVETLQALAIVTFVEIHDDNPRRASSLLGILTQGIHFIEIPSMDAHREDCGTVFGKHATSSAAMEWIQQEERGRLFWIVYMMDRLCVNILASPPCLLARNRLYKLPVCGGFWYTNQAYPTPYMTISEPSTAHLHLSMSQLLSKHTQVGNCAPEFQAPNSSSTSGVGALAFYMEAVESLSLVISHFVQQSVDPADRHQVSRWLTRFKELDLHLIQWKRRLPQQWKDSGASRVTAPGMLDPNMTAANATHNSTLILLHESIAVPDARLSAVQLPSACSAETCQNAAVETCTITRKFLDQWKPHRPVSVQLGLCAFISARYLLRELGCSALRNRILGLIQAGHSRHYSESLAPAFWTLLQCLEDMSQLWQGHAMVDDAQRPKQTLFSRFALRLQQMYAKCQLDPLYTMDNSEPLYDCVGESSHEPASNGIQMQTLTTVSRPSIPTARSGLTDAGDDHASSTYHYTSPSSIAPDRRGTYMAPSLEPWRHQTANSAHDDLAAVSQTLMGADFGDMDRIVSFDEMMLNGISEAPTLWNFG